MYYIRDCLVDFFFFFRFLNAGIYVPGTCTIIVKY